MLLQSILCTFSSCFRPVLQLIASTYLASTPFKSHIKKPQTRVLQVAFDPLDGSSIVAANFAVGSIFGIWPGDQLIGRKGREQAAAVYAVYGPKTILVVALPLPGEGGSASIAIMTSAVSPIFSAN